MRVANPHGKVRFTVNCGDTVLATAVKLKAVPGEMEKIVLKKEKLAAVSGQITVKLEDIV